MEVNAWCDVFSRFVALHTWEHLIYKQKILEQTAYELQKSD